MMTTDVSRNCIAPLFVPGDRPDRLDKALSSGADAVILDLEDAVAPTHKDQARAHVARLTQGKAVIVRVNALGTPWHALDLATAVEGSVAGIMLPKTEGGAEWSALCQTLSNRLPVIALIETGRGLARARDIAATPGVARLAFGSVDYCADLGCEHTAEALLHARSELVLASRLAGLPAPLDGVTTSITADELWSDDARRAAGLGFGGKLCIHPRQVSGIMAAFTPGEASIAWAERVLARAEGATALDGEMVDEPVRRQAQAILRKAGRRA
jgi:citrate lyase subunit beta/citryl-CoA lyase